MVIPKGMRRTYAVWENRKVWEGDEKPLAVGDNIKELFKKYPNGVFGGIWVKKKRGKNVARKL